MVTIQLRTARASSTNSITSNTRLAMAFTAFGRTHADGLVFVARLEVVGTHARL